MGVPERTLRKHHPDVFRAAELKVGRPTYQPTSEEREFVHSQRRRASRTPTSRR